MTFCIAVEQELTVSVCPLKAGACYWQHRKTHACCYTEEDMTPTEFCERVGLTKVPDEADHKKFLAALKLKLT